MGVLGEITNFYLNETPVTDSVLAAYGRYSYKIKYLTLFDLCMADSFRGYPYLPDKHLPGGCGHQPGTLHVCI